jgi:hypothetical protein
MQTRLPFFTLLLLISFASVNAVLFTPALPNIARFFGIIASQKISYLIWVSGCIIFSFGVFALKVLV